MIKVNFHKPLTALEIRYPAFEVCKEVANEFDLFVTFHQPQQGGLAEHSGQRGRRRIGNGKHKNWFIDYQTDEPQVSRPRTVGRIGLRAPFCPDEMQFGGFEYGNNGKDQPAYRFITVHTVSELGINTSKDPSPDILAMTYQGLKDCFEAKYPRLFDIDPFDKQTLPNIIK